MGDGVPGPAALPEAPAVSGVQRLDHVGVNVPDLREAVAFFVTAFGARVVFELPAFNDVEGGALTRLGVDRHAVLALAMIEIGDARLELLEWSNVDGGTWPAAAMLGSAHVAVEVDDLDAALDRLRGLAGVTVIGEPVTFEQGPTPGLANAFAVAPWGLLVELVCWTAGRP